MLPSPSPTDLFKTREELYLGKKQKFLTVVSNLQTGEPLWFGRERKQETLDEFFQTQLSAFQRGALQAACVDMHEPYRLSLERWVPQCRLVYDTQTERFS